MKHSVDLKNISRFFFAADLAFVANKEGTENCEAKFRLTHEQEQIVRSHFRIPFHLPIQFATSELAAQGNGWYLAFSMSEKPDQALKAILNIKAALWHAQNRKLVEQHIKSLAAKELALKIVAKVKPKRRVLVKKTVDTYGRVCVKTIDRTLQALTTDEGYGLHKFRTESIRNLMCQADIGLAVNHLQTHFSPVHQPKHQHMQAA
jgi:hypothetical protein